MGICLKQFECLGVLTDRIRVEPKGACCAPVVLLGENGLPRHLCCQFGDALYVLSDRFPDKAAGFQIRFRFGQGGFQFALAQVRVLLAAHHHVFHLAADRHRSLWLIGERLFDCTDALGFQVIRGDCVHISRTIYRPITRIVNSTIQVGKCCSAR